MRGRVPPAACAVTTEAQKIPGCDSGPVERLRFVVKEMRDLVRELMLRRKSR